MSRNTSPVDEDVIEAVEEDERTSIIARLREPAQPADAEIFGSVR